MTILYPKHTLFHMIKVLAMQVYGKFAKSQNISMFIYQQCGKFPDKFHKTITTSMLNFT